MRNEIQEAAESVVGGKGLRVAAYYRMSDDEQKLSIGQQQKEVRRFAASRGWEIVAEYVDSGKSGSKNIAARVEFHRLISDAKKGNWQAVICYNSSRFGRLDAIDSAPYKSELRKHGIYLETVTEGRIDWRTSMGRIQDALLSEQNHKYSLDISANSTRGRADIAERGWWSVGEIPFGYDRQFVDAVGAVQMVVAREKRFSKPRNWHTTLIVNENEAETVRDIFNRFKDQDISIRQLVRQLNEESAASPGSSWSPQNLGRVLRDKSYIGVARVGFARKSKEAHKRLQQSERENACPKIVDGGVFEAVQKKLQGRANGGNSSQFKSGALSGVLVCGNCGYRMEKCNKGGKTYYVCASARVRPQFGCRQWSVKEQEILNIVSAELLQTIDAEFLKRLTQKPKRADANLEGLRKAVAKLEQQYERARKNLLLADTDIFASLQADTLNLKAELDRSKNTLALAETEGATDAVESLRQSWEQRKGLLVAIARKMPLGDTSVDIGEGGKIEPLNVFGKGKSAEVQVTQMVEKAAVRDLLKSLNATVTLHWTPSGKRFFNLSTATIKAEIGKNVLNDRKDMPTPPAPMLP